MPGAVDPAQLDCVPGPGDGGVVRFLGIVRDRGPDGRRVVGLTYQAYEPMAVAEFERIAAEACAHYGDVRLGILHAVGELDAGEIAVAVIAAAPHRAAAFEACRFAIDALKARAPIWKNERYADGTSAWSANEAS